MATEGKAGPHSRRRADEVPPAPERSEELKSIVPAFTRLRLIGYPPLGIPKGDACLSKNTSET